MADYYDLIVGLHPDQALREVVASASVRPVLVVPCCNFWTTEKLGQTALLDAIETDCSRKDIAVRRLTLACQGPKNIALHLTPPPGKLIR